MQPALWAAFFWFPLAYAIVRYGGVEKIDGYLCLAAIGVVTLVYHAKTRRYEIPPPPVSGLRWSLIALPLYALWQLVPLPPALLSAERVRVSAALSQIGIHPAWIPVSVLPWETVFQLSRLCGCALVFLAARSLTWRWRERAWYFAVPLIATAVAEAALGLAQSFAAPDGIARGTYVNRNHFAGLLEMALPFAVAYPFAAMRHRHRFEAERLGPALRACLALAAAALILAAITYSLSRSGFVAALLSLGWVAILAAIRRLPARTRIAAGLAGMAALLALFVFLPPDRLIERFGIVSRFEALSADTRVHIWRDTTRLISNYPVFGCGLGAYEAALYPYRTVALDTRIDYAHNDYLQGLAELGVPGVLILGVLWISLLVEAARAVRMSGHIPFALGAAGALAAISVHSVTDFNLYIPANALVAAWAGGIVSGLAAR